MQSALPKQASISAQQLLWPQVSQGPPLSPSPICSHATPPAWHWARQLSLTQFAAASKSALPLGLSAMHFSAHAWSVQGVAHWLIAEQSAFFWHWPISAEQLVCWHEAQSSWPEPPLPLVPEPALPPEPPPP